MTGSPEGETALVAFLGSLPPLDLSSLTLERTADVITARFATGGGDDEHVRFAISAGHPTSATIEHVTAEGKARAEIRVP